MRTMKDSEIGWIGQIPKNWLIKQAKFVLDIYTGATPKSQVPEYWDGDILWVTPADYKTEDVYITDTKKHITQSGYESCSTTIVPRGSLIFSKRAPIGTVAIADKDLCTNQGCLACVCNNNALYKYIYYQMQSLSDIFNSLGEGTTFLEISYSSFRSVKFVLPSLSEQKAIADYLDDKCAKIDTTIAKRKAIIEKLKDYKSAVVTKAVTKGLNPNVEMKDSGVKFIKNIPNKWNVKRLKFILSKKLRYGASESGVEYNSNLPRYIRITDIDENGCLKNEGKLSLTEEAAKNYILEEDCILLARSGATVGKTFLYTMEMPRSAFAGYLIQAIPNGDEITPKFFMYYTNSNPYWMWIGYIFEQATIMNVSAEKYQNLYVCYPSVSEQNDIVAYLDSQCAKIDEAIEKQEQAVAKLEEYRKSIIYYAVTGKIDCRDI